MSKEFESECSPCKKVCIVGMGVSSLPLVKLLEERSVDFCVVSEQNFGVWQKLDSLGEDFDLVTTIESTNYSWWDFKYEFPFYTAKQYYALLKAEITPSITSKIIRKQVGRVSEGADGVYTVLDEAGGTIVCAHNVVFAIGLRPDPTILGNMGECNRIKDSTVLLRGYSDTSSMYMSRLARHGNAIFLAAAHFSAFDKIDFTPLEADKPDGPFEWYPFDQGEPFTCFRNGMLPLSFFTGVGLGQNPLVPSSKIQPCIYVPHFFHSWVLHLWRLVFRSKVMPNIHWYDGQADNEQLAVKYWSVDAYQKLYDIPKYGDFMRKSNVFLNDALFLKEMGIVKIIRYEDVEEIDGKTYVNHDGERHSIDRVFTSGRAKQPQSMLYSASGEHVLYEHSENLFGLWNPETPNVYHLGTTRPITGAFGSMAELQGMFVTRMITEPTFKEEIQRTAATQLADHKAQGHFNSTFSMYSGMQCTMIGDAIGCQPSMRKLFSKFDLLRAPFCTPFMWYYGPCNALRYRIEGPFAVEGAGEAYVETSRYLLFFFLPGYMFDHFGIRFMLSNSLITTAAAAATRFPGVAACGISSFPASAAVAATCFVVPQGLVARIARNVCQPMLSLVTAFSAGVELGYLIYPCIWGGKLLYNLRNQYHGDLQVNTAKGWLQANGMFATLAVLGSSVCIQKVAPDFFGLIPGYSKAWFNDMSYKNFSRDPGVTLREWFFETYLKRKED